MAWQEWLDEYYTLYQKGLVSPAIKESLIAF